MKKYLGGVRNHGLAVRGIRSSPCFSNSGFEIHYLCKQELGSKSAVRVYTSICALDQVSENWPNLCKLYNNQKEYGSVTPGCGKETSSMIRHKAGLEAAAVSASKLGDGELRRGFGKVGFLSQDQGERGTYTQWQHLKTCVLISYQPRLLMVS